MCETRWTMGMDMAPQQPITASQSAPCTISGGQSSTLPPRAAARRMGPGGGAGGFGRISQQSGSIVTAAKAA